MTILSNLRSLFVSPLPMAGTAPGGQAGRAALDGRNFDGIVLKCGETSGDADTLTFKDGRFRSSACDPYGYGDGAYKTSAAEDGLAFEAVTESPQYGTLLWRGVVRGSRLDGTLTMMKEGKPAAEKWVIAGEPQ